MAEIEYIHSLKYGGPEYHQPNHNSRPLKKMCVVCVELEHSTSEGSVVSFQKTAVTVLALVGVFLKTAVAVVLKLITAVAVIYILIRYWVCLSLCHSVRPL